MKKILLMAALFAGITGNGFAMDGEELFFCDLSEGSECFPDGLSYSDFYDSEGDSDNSSGTKVIDKSQQNYEQILRSGLEDIDECDWKSCWTEEQKIAAIDNWNKFEDNETQASGHEITEDMEIRFWELFPNTWQCIESCINIKEIGLEEADGKIKYKYVQPEVWNAEQEKMSGLVKSVIMYNDCIRNDYVAIPRMWTMMLPHSDWQAHIDKGLREGVLKKQTLGTATPDREYGWTVRFVKIPDLSE